jgi:hypothetical protein
VVKRSGHDRLRRLRRSWWVALPALSLGLLTGDAFLYAGLRARRPAWCAAGALYGLAGVAVAVALGLGAAVPGLIAALTLAVLGTIHALLIRRAFLRDVTARDLLDRALPSWAAPWPGRRSTTSSPPLAGGWSA